MVCWKLKRLSKKCVLFEDFKMVENISKMGFNDLVVFGCCIESRDNEEEVSFRFLESENSGRGSSYWSVVEFDLSVGLGIKFVSIVYFLCSFFLLR